MAGRFFSLLFLCTLFASIGANAETEKASANKVTSIKLWNGNKTASRQQYEREVLEAALVATQAHFGKWNLQEDKTDYPAAADEASVFSKKGFDIFGTVAGNTKLADEPKILIPQPLMKGLLGYRILIIRAADKAKFAAIKSPHNCSRCVWEFPPLGPMPNCFAKMVTRWKRRVALMICLYVWKIMNSIM
ncbi:hypothetical protein [Cellvibrio sp. NN19]|uniref:hypothetical protein n=1 Tax=Cellvibrio chitinivorans TaxID=3102792 RepID=UPI002B41136F|nr:hypothetical protein [Cellvibrio sp. NN19]